MNFKALALLCLGLSTAVLIRADGPLVINEIHSNPDIKTELVEFIELFNPTGSEVDVSAWRFTEGVEFTFPAGTKVPGFGYLVVTENTQHFQQKFSRTALGPWAGKLASEGEQITLRNAAGAVIDTVTYQEGFPWPIVGDEPGSSMELVNPAFDNDLGGNWRPAVPGGVNAPTLNHAANWRYFKGTSEASNPTTAWRQVGFNDSAWLSAPGPLGFGDGAVRTTLSDMRNNYRTVFLRKEIEIPDPSAIKNLSLEIFFDDGVNVWINGRHVLRQNLPTTEVPFNQNATLKSETGTYERFNISSAIPFLQVGKNVLSIQAHNTDISTSSDFYIDARLNASAGGSVPTPGAANSVLADNMGPVLRQADHSPEKPSDSSTVLLTIKATDPDGIASVRGYYQVVRPGSYIEKADPFFAENWRPLSMRDDGVIGDERANDGVYTGVIAGPENLHRTLIRYRFTATDTGGRVTTAPHPEDPQPNFAYFVYDGVPTWTGAIQPTGSDPARRTPVTYSREEMDRLPVYHLISKKTAVENSTWRTQFGFGDPRQDEYLWTGTLVYDGKVYDHIRYRPRGGVWRHAMGKNMWKFDFNRGHSFQARDNWGEKYDTTWTKLNIGANIQQGDFQHRGEQGMFESVGFRMFDLAGLESPETHWVQFRVIDEVAESASSQYTNDFWGVYLAIEQEDGRFLDEHNLPDGNLYKMENGTGELNNLGFLGPDDKSDLNAFQSAISSNQTDTWWRQNFDLDRYYNYHAIVQAIHHYDISFGKNYFWFNNPETRQWSVLPWDLDLTWADNMYSSGSGGRDTFTPVLSRPAFNIEFENRVRELRDLLYNADQAHQVIDEYANLARGTNQANLLAADRAMWDYHPVMVSTFVNSSKAGHGRFYQFPLESSTNSALRGSFDALVQIMKNYVDRRAAFMDQQYSDSQIPATPTITSAGEANFPVNAVRLRSSAFSGVAPFAAIKWRVGEITPGPVKREWPPEPRKYEIEAAWESGEYTTANYETPVPAHVLKPGHTYRARVKMKDATGRWSHWSAPLTFTASEAENSQALADHLRVTEVMYDPATDSNFEFVELYNTSASIPLVLDGVSFTSGISFTFTNLTLPPNGYVVLHKAATPTALAEFVNYYNLGANVLLAGPFGGSLNNSGEQVRIKSTLAGRDLMEFEFADRRHWPGAADGAGHSLVPNEAGLVSPPLGSLNYPRNWRASREIKGSPGAADPDPTPSLVISEVMARTTSTDPNHPEHDSNDWIELQNPTGLAIDASGFYLSDEASNLRKWPLPSGSFGAGAFRAYYEIGGFHDPITNGFGLDSNGETIYLSQAGANGSFRVVDSLQYEGQVTNASWGLLPTAPRIASALLPTPGAVNKPLPPTALITELMYHPEADAATGQPGVEFVEVKNVGAADVLFAGLHGNWRIAGGIDFAFPNPVKLFPDQTLLIVGFNPTDTAALAAFRQKYTIPNDVRVVGPFTGKLDNTSDTVSLERPEAPSVVGGAHAWVVVDEIVYYNGQDWPRTVNDSPLSIHRLSPTNHANLGFNWVAGDPGPGFHFLIDPLADRDGDGMPDIWEEANMLNPDKPDATGDMDDDGSDNLHEYLAGTVPYDSDSAFRVVSIATDSSGLTIRFQAVAGRTYQIQATDSIQSGPWATVAEREITQPQTASATVPFDINAEQRFYRVTVAESQ